MGYRKLNNVFGWVIFAVSSFVYLKTMEPTASYWDCGEFLSCAYKLEVGHSPGAPFFMMVQRLFGIFAPSPAKAAMFINSLSAFMSGFTILFLFWTITHMARKLIAPGIGAEPDDRQKALIIGAGLVGGLAYTFSDTFWFSAVEAEVYATSSFFTAISFWAILKWEDIADNKHADRWLVLIAYLIGISVGVHLLNLLTIPALGMVYYYRRYPNSTGKGALLAFFVSCIVLAFVQFGVIQYIPIIASKFDILFVNSFGLPFDSGSITFMILFVGLLIWLLFYARKKGNYILHTAVLCITFIVIGYSSYLAAIVRSRANVPIDMTNPDNTLSLVSYVSRDQFGEQPLLYGQDFTARPIDYKFKGYMYSQTKQGGKDYYEEVGKKQDPVYDPSDMRFFPRMYENMESSHAQFYRSYVGLSENEHPSTRDNFTYFFGYQMNWMWWRYFMWNYVGRQNDFEGQGGPKNGNWMSGIKPVDKMFGLGDTDKMADGYRNNCARNQLYFLPFILGILGLIYQFNNSRRDGIATFVLFFFTGAAIGIYLNMPPLQPRERDYAFAGCTYAFAIWIGLGVLMINDWLQRIVKGKPAVYLTTALCLLCVPVLMAKEEWNDHDRSQKTLARATAYNTLSSCAPNAILFTFGDNDTYPLWYLQEVEGIRRDVRIINTSLLGIDWYIDQLNYRINDADAIPMIWKKEDYVGDRHNYVRYFADPKLPKDRYFSLEELCKFMVSNNKLPTQGGEEVNYLPSKNFNLPALSKDELIKRGLLKPADTGNVITDINCVFPKDIAMKNDLAILNMIAGIAKQGWNRPVYFDAGLPASNYAGLADYMQLEGLVYRLMPYKYSDVVAHTRQSELGTINLDKSYDLFMNKYIWGGADRNDVYFDEKNRIMFVSYRLNAASIANAMAAEGRRSDAVQVLDKVRNGISEHSYSYDLTGYYLATGYYAAGAIDKGKLVALKTAKNAEDNLTWIQTLSENRQQDMVDDIRQNVSMLNSLGMIARSAKDDPTASMLSTKARYYADTVFRTYFDPRNR